MAYAAVTSLMETLSLNFLQSQPPFPLEHLAAQIRDDANRNLDLLQQIFEDMATKDVEVELDEAASSKCIPRLHGIFNNGAVKQSDYPKKKKKKLIKSEKQQQQQLLAECSSQNERIINRLREVGEVKQKIVSLHQNLGLLQQSLEKSEIPYDDARVMKDLEAQIRDASFKLEQRIEMELSAIYLAKDSLLWLHQIFYEAQKQTDYQIRDGNENLGLLQQIIEAKIREMELDEEASSSKRLHTKACLPRLYGKAYQQQLARLREVGEVKQKMLSLHQNLGLLQKDILQKSEIGNDDAGAMKDLEAEIRDVAKDNRLHITASLLRLHEILIEAEKQTDYHRNELIRIQTHEYQLVKGSSLHDLVHKKIIVSNFSKNASKFDNNKMVGCDKVFEKILDQLLTQQKTKGRQVVSVVGMGGIGKTTLAHKVYEHLSNTSYFDMRAWVTVSQEYNIEQMLRCLLGCVTAASRDDDQDQLAECLRKHLKEKRYLIVMDDI
ncbi:uncharacterized protein LOC115997459 isoform X2 [Ipomoea triloba]|uniref:uncharacterized protein LOC115997459 isoform X2 n=1 Tax=Ipomoea triloba TaxID=35885 RepID=UPI00125E1452|nr:uncharacterized protein LOC115997459 isoform X2 [Ipomoea triloba]XP_031092876.1 uncharacterized protein LOC115997459 isoform X2 [Ipomoea triloba]XP_031092877.1 uncharacterized protein LOC115997459 isoform X2 [Ipomoea triloba]